MQLRNADFAMTPEYRYQTIIAETSTAHRSTYGGLHACIVWRFMYRDLGNDAASESAKDLVQGVDAHGMSEV